jgi:hypothetical protein
MQAPYQMARGGAGGTTLAGSVSAAAGEGEPGRAFREIALDQSSVGNPRSESSSSTDLSTLVAVVIED